MATNLVDLARARLTPEVIQHASLLVDESPTSTQRAMETATPTIVAVLIEKASTISGAGRLIALLEESGLTGTMAGVTRRAPVEGGAIDSVVQSGKELLARLFGAGVGPLVDATASSSGVKRSSMDSLLGFATPLVLGAVGSEVAARHLDAVGLAHLLAEQKSEVVRALPGGVAAAAFAPSLSQRTGAASAPGRAEAASPAFVAGASRQRIPWVLLLIIPLALVLGYRLRHRAPMGATAPNAAPEVAIAPPVAHPPGVGEGTAAEQLGRFLASPGGELPRRFVLDNLNFDFATAHLAPASSSTLDSVAEVLKQHPTAAIVLEGHTDNIGDAAGNQLLSQRRADAVKAALVERGIAADRIKTAGLGQDRPIVANDSDEARAKNRRTEIVVVRR